MTIATSETPLALSSARVIVTGATGFLGGHVVPLLLQEGAEVIAVIDRGRSTLRHGALPGSVRVEHFDTSEELVQIVRFAAPDFVIHLHAFITTERTPAALQSTLKSNLLASIDLMSACVEAGVKRLIVMGSGEEFGPVTGPFDDSTIPDPPSPYGASKAAVTCYARMFHRAFNLPVTVIRPSVVYGPRQSPRMLIPQVMHALAKGVPIDVTEGRQTRDFIYAEDVGRGLVAALRADRVAGRSFNLGSGEITTVKECLARIEQISGRTGLIRYGALPYKKGEIFSYEPILEETLTTLRWHSLIPLEEGLTKTWESIQATSAR